MLTRLDRTRPTCRSQRSAYRAPGSWPRSRYNVKIPWQRQCAGTEGLKFNEPNKVRGPFSSQRSQRQENEITGKWVVVVLCTSIQITSLAVCTRHVLSMVFMHIPKQELIAFPLSMQSNFRFRGYHLKTVASQSFFRWPVIPWPGPRTPDE